MLRWLKNMLAILKSFFRKEKKINSFKCIPGEKTVTEIRVPIIAVEKYPGMVLRGVKLTEQVAGEIANNKGVKKGDILNNLEITNIFSYITTAINLASDQFFEYIGFVLYEGDIEDWDNDETVRVELITKIKKMGLADLLKVLRKVYEVNEFVEVKDDPLFRSLKQWLGQAPQMLMK